MMQVVVTDRAFSELEQIFSWWREHRSVEQASRWYNAFVDAIADLSQNAERRPISRERKAFPYEIRDLFFGTGKRPTHRAVFTISDQMVIVLAIRHLAQKPLSADES